MNKHEAEKSIQEIQKMHSKGDDKEALAEALKLLESAFEDINVRFAVSGIFIDSGGALGDIEIVSSGITMLQDLLEESNISLSEEVVITSKYNISNGLYIRFQLLKKQGDLVNAFIELHKAKDFIQDVLLNQNKLDLDLRNQAMVNYGNILDHFDRSVEAIDWYYDAIKGDPNHALAMGNCGIAIRKLINVSGNHKSKNVYEAWSLLAKTCDMKLYVEIYSGNAAYEYFKAHLEDLLLVIEKNVDGGLTAIKNNWIHRLEAHGSPKSETWLEVINNDRLLLTLNQKPMNSESECVDDLFFDNLITSVGTEGEKRFTELAHWLNVLKEDFATARYLYYHSIDPKMQFAKHNKITKFVDAFDYSSFGIGLGLQKASFRIAADCLDKVAMLINEYFDLRQRGHVNINNVWYLNKEQKQGLLQPIADKLKENPFLRALKGLQEDWFLESFPGPLKKIRNKATHLKLVIYEMRVINLTSDGNDWDTEIEFPKYTYYLLRIVKAAIIYMVFAMNIEESKKGNDNSFRGRLPFELR